MNAIDVELRAGQHVTVDEGRGRKFASPATFVRYVSDTSARVRFDGQTGMRNVPIAKIRPAK
jgi:hypothetical protein